MSILTVRARAHESHMKEFHFTLFIKVYDSCSEHYMCQQLMVNLQQRTQMTSMFIVLLSQIISSILSISRKKAYHKESAQVNACINIRAQFTLMITYNHVLTLGELRVRNLHFQAFLVA